MPDSPGLFTLQANFTRTLTVDHVQVPSDQSDFPVLVSVTDSTLKTIANGGHVIGTNAFTFSSDSAGVNLLKWEVERYNATTGEIVAWVKVAVISSGSDTTFYLKYGGSITTDQSDPTNVWTNSFTARYGLKDGTTLSVVDSRNLFNGTNNGATATAGQIDGGGGFASASNQYISLPDGMLTDAMTVSAWVNGASFPNAYNNIWSSNNNLVAQFFHPYVKSTGKLAMYLANTIGTTISYDGTGSHTLSAGTSYLIHMVYSSAVGLIGYVNAASDGTAAADGTIRHSNTQINDIGADDNSVTRQYYWNGTIDEVRVSSVARSADWITCEYNNQKSGSTFVTLGAET